MSAPIPDPLPAGQPIDWEAADSDADIDLRSYGVEDWFILAFFWGLAILVFLQFFTRYVLNNSLSWTEEIAQYVLIATTFVGASMAARKSQHIVVEFLYVYLNPHAAFALSTLTDAICIAFYGFSAWLSWKVMLVMQHQLMIAIPYPLSLVYALVLAGFVGMTFRQIQVAIRNFKDGRSHLTQVRVEGRHQ